MEQNELLEYWNAPRGKDEPDVLIVSTMRNEGPYILEWLAHYISCGARHFLIFSNDSDDGTPNLLNALAAAGIITHVPHSPPSDQSVQRHAFRAAWKHALRQRADWALVCDVDEFINIKTPDRSFTGLISALPSETDAIALPWRNFGAVESERALEEPVTQSCTRAMSQDLSYPVASTLFKTLFKLSGPFNQFGVHRPSQKRPDKAALPNWVDGSGHPLPERFAGNAGHLSLLNTKHGRDLADMHHYSLRSSKEFIIKRHRGLPHNKSKDIGLRYWAERNFITEIENSLAYYSQNTANLRKALLGLPGVAPQYARGLQWHTEAFDELMQNEANYQLYSDTRLLAGSRELSEAEAKALYARYAASGFGQNNSEA